jgi:3-dehydroquinate synthase
VVTVDIPDGEEAKHLQVVSDVYDVLERSLIGRLDTIVGLGGGAATDLAGFVASTWMRGIEVVQIPTTLLAAVDAAIGGKTGIDRAGKNLVGTFWDPSRVLVNLEIMRALPPDRLRDGLAEIIKIGLVADPALFGELEGPDSSLDLEALVRAAISTKLAVIVDDPYDLDGRRAILNFGHTIGHAVERAGSLTHGEAVAVGMVAAGHLSAERLGFEALARIEACLRLHGLPLAVPGIRAGAVIDLLALDKKKDESGLRMVLLADLGRPMLVPVDFAEIEPALSAIGIDS